MEPSLRSALSRRDLVKGVASGAAALGASVSADNLHAQPTTFHAPKVRHAWIQVGPVNVFYRETGEKGLPVLLLLHGFANSSHYFRHLMPLLASHFHLIAPDLPSFGFTTVSDEKYPYTFAQLTHTMQGFVDALGLRRFAMYVFDYGAPIGFNLALARPEWITGIVSQNGNIYEEGLGSGPWQPLRDYWKQPSEAIRESIRQRMSLEGVRSTYLHGVPDAKAIEPESYWLDSALLAQPGMQERQVDLKLDYKANFVNYPRYQEFLRTHRPAVLAIWGKNDTFFLPAGAQAFKRDVPEAKVILLDTGHFALETHHEQIADAILQETRLREQKHPLS